MNFAFGLLTTCVLAQNQVIWMMIIGILSDILDALIPLYPVLQIDENTISIGKSIDDCQYHNSDESYDFNNIPK